MIQMFDGKHSDISPGAYVHEKAVVIGDVKIGAQSSVWPCAVLRGDVAQISIGKRTSIQDGCILHTDRLPLTIGDDVTVGHGAVLHSCDIGSSTMIGMGAIILDAASIGDECIIAAGTLIPGGKVIPPRSLAMGNPYRIVRRLTDEDIAKIKRNADFYIELIRKHIRTGILV